MKYDKLFEQEYDTLCQALGREPSDDEVTSYIEICEQIAKDRHYDQIENEWKEGWKN